jgi:hypothetical protein
MPILADACLEGKGDELYYLFLLEEARKKQKQKKHPHKKWLPRWVCINPRIIRARRFCNS